MSRATQFPARMDVADFMDWCPEDGQAWQLVDGEPVAMAPASLTHARIQAEICTGLIGLGVVVRRRRRGGDCGVMGDRLVRVRGFRGALLGHRGLGGPICQDFLH